MGKTIYDDQEQKGTLSVIEIYAYFNQFNEANEFMTSADSGQSPSTDSPVRIFGIKRNALRSRSQRHESSTHWMASRVPFYYSAHFIYDSNSNARLACLPIAVLDIPNSVKYNERSKTLVVFLQNHTTCFFLMNEQQDELSIDEFMGLQSDMFGTSILPSDRCLFNYFKQSSSKIRMFNSSTYLDRFSDGIFLGSSSDENIANGDNRFDFRSSLPKKDDDGYDTIVLVDAYALTPLGLSVLFWVFPISFNNKGLLKAIMQELMLNTCFSKKVLADEGAGEHTALIIPEQWVMEFIAGYNFMAKHSVFGDFGVCIGMDGLPEDSYVRTGQPESRHGLLSRVRGDSSFAVLDIILRKSEFEDEEEHQDQDEDEDQTPEKCKLFYREYARPRWSFKLNSLKFSLPFAAADF